MNSKATTRIKQLCSLGFESQILVPVLLPALRKAIPSYSSTFLWTTNDYRFVNFYDECSDTLNYLHLYHSEYLDKYDHEARPSLSEWLRNKSGVCTSEKFYYPHYIRTDFYNDILRPLRYHHELIVGIKHEQRPVGILFLHREAKQPNFSKAEVEYMQQLLPFITHGLSRETNYTDAHFSDGRSGILIFSATGKLQYMSALGRQLLLLVTHPVINKHSLTNDKVPKVPVELTDLCQRLAGLFGVGKKNTAFTLPYWLHKNAWGSFIFRAHWLNHEEACAESLIAVNLEHRLPAAISVLHACEECGLSPKQTSVIAHIALGHNYEHISNSLHISTNTVVDHVRKVYDKLGVSNHAQLLRELKTYSANMVLKTETWPA